MRGKRGRILLCAGIVAIAGGYAAAPPQAAASTPAVVLGHVPQASAPINATIVIPRNAQARGYQLPGGTVTISQGGQLNVFNNDTQEHTVTSNGVDAQGHLLFDTWVNPGHTLTIPGASRLAAGRYTFHCTFHPGTMTGTLVVEGGSGGGIHPGQLQFPLALKQPPVLTGSNLTIPVRQADVRILPSGATTRMWTYGGTYPGPTIERPAGKDTKVTFINKLPKRAGSITVHFHGDHHRWQDDGQPDRFLIKRGAKRTYDLPLTDHGRPETEAIDWYHDHRMDLTARNNWEGLQGMFLIHDKRERQLDLPSGRFDVPLFVSDRSFTSTNQLTNPIAGRHRAANGMFTGPFAPPGDHSVGAQILVDGRLRPHLNVAQHRYRLRLVNGSPFQAYDFALSDGRPFVQIGTGSGLLPKPVVRPDILLGPAQRADVVVDFAGELHQRVLLQSIPRTNRPPSGMGTPTVSLMQFRVTRTATDHTKVPRRLEAPPPIKVPKKPAFTWTVSLKGNASTGTTWAINGRPFDVMRVEHEAPLGSTQLWVLRNVSPITHFIHLHEEQWHTILRDGKRPPPWERGLEDTWRLDPGETVEVAAKFTDYTGVFMLHCHMLNHEDDGMMAEFAVVKPHTHKLPRGYYLVGHGGSHHRTAMAMSMDMPSGGSGGSSFGTDLTGWRRTAFRSAEALAVQLLAIFAVVGVRRYWRLA